MRPELHKEMENLALLNPEMDNFLRKQGLEYDIRVDGFRAMKGYWPKSDALAFGAWAIDCYKKKGEIRMTSQEQVQLARYKEATIRADDTIAALERTVLVQREVIDLLHIQIGRMERQMEELRAAL